MARIGLIGPSYTSQSPNADAQELYNWYVENDETGMGKSAAMLYPMPGLKEFATLTDELSVPQLFTILGRTFAAATNFWEIASPGVAINFGNLSASAQGTSSMVASNTKVLICSGGNLFVFTLATNAFAAVNMAQFNGPIVKVEYLFGFFIAQQQDSNTFYVSDVLDPTTWNALSAEGVNLFSGNIVTIIVSHGELYVAGTTTSIAYGLNQQANSPLSPNTSAIIEQGAVSLFGVSRLDNTLLWWGQDDRGQLVAWRGNGYTPQRVSNHAIETLVQNFQTANDVICYSFQYEGHLFWVSYFPFANVTLYYDVATGFWGKMAGWASGKWTAHPSQCHTWNPSFQKHLVGDPFSGNIYEMAQKYVDNAGQPIRRQRITPPISTEGERLFHRQLELALESGLGPAEGIAAPSTFPQAYVLADASGNPWLVTMDDNAILSTQQTTGITPGAPVITDNLTGQSFVLSIDDQGRVTADEVPFDSGAPIVLPFATTSFLDSGVYMLNGQLVTTNPSAGTRAPQIMLRWTDDAHTYSNYYVLGCGKAGEYRKRVIKRRLGVARQRSYDISTTDSIPWRIIDGYLTADGSNSQFKPTERMAKQIGKAS